MPQPNDLSRSLVALDQNSIPQPFAENTEVHVDRDPRGDSDQGRGKILQKRDSRHAQRIILQVEGHDRAEAHKNHHLPAIVGYCPVKLPILRTADEERSDLVAQQITGSEEGEHAGKSDAGVG